MGKDEVVDKAGQTVLERVGKKVVLDRHWHTLLEPRAGMGGKGKYIRSDLILAIHGTWGILGGRGSVRMQLWNQVPGYGRGSLEVPRPPVSR